MIEDSNFIVDFLVEINCVRIQTSIVENCGNLGHGVRLLISEEDGREDVDQIDTLTNEQEGESELISSVDFLNISLETAVDIKEPNKTSTGIVSKTCQLGNYHEDRNQKTFLEYVISGVGPKFKGENLKWLKSFKYTYVSWQLCKISQVNSQYSTLERNPNISHILNFSWLVDPIIFVVSLDVSLRVRKGNIY